MAVTGRVSGRPEPAAVIALLEGDDHEVEHLADQLGVVVALQQARVQLGAFGAEGAQHGREQRRRGALERADVDAPDGAGLEPPHRGGGGVGRVDHLAAVGQQHLAQRGQLDRSRAAGPVEQRLPHRALQRGDLLADRRLRVAQPGRRATEGAGRRDGVERHEMAQFQVTSRDGH